MSWFWKKETPTKPVDRVEYGLGFACENDHCQSMLPASSTTRSILYDEQICQVCGEKAFPSVIKLTVEYVWCVNPYRFNESFYWEESASGLEFVRFLDEDTVRLEEETVATLRKYAARRYQESDENADLSYQKGLNDGTIMTAKYVLGELKEEKNA